MTVYQWPRLTHWIVGVGVTEAAEEAAHAAEVEAVVGVGPGAARHAGALVVAEPVHVVQELHELPLLASSTGHRGYAAAAAPPPQQTARPAEGSRETGGHAAGPRRGDRGGGLAKGGRRVAGET